MGRHNLEMVQCINTRWNPGSILIISRLSTFKVTAITFVMMVVEIVAGMALGSMALLADGWHMLTHVAALDHVAVEVNAWIEDKPVPAGDDPDNCRD